MRITISATLLLSLAAAPASAQGRRDASIDLTGKWDLTVTTDGQVGASEVTLVQRGDSLIGRYAHRQLGDLEVVGSVKGREFSFAYSAAMNGQQLTFTVKGTVQSADSLTGTASLGPMGAASFVAKRQRERSG